MCVCGVCGCVVWVCGCVSVHECVYVWSVWVWVGVCVVVIVCVCVVGIGACEECGYVGVGRVCMLYVIHVCTYVCCV